MHLTRLLVTSATILCLSWLVVGCWEDVVTKVEPIVEPTVTKKSSLINALVIDSSLPNVLFNDHLLLNPQLTNACV